MILGRWWGAAAMAVVMLQAAPSRADLSHLTVDEAVKMALRDNSTVYTAARQVAQAEGTLASSRTAIFPQVSATGTLSHDHSGAQTSSITENTIAPTNTNTTRGSITGSLDVLDLETWNTIRAAARSLDATRMGEASTRQAVALAVRQEFYAFVRAKLIARVDSATAGLDSSNLGLTQALFEVGTAPKTDVLKAKTTKSQGDLTLITARHTVDLERLRLASLLGLADDRGLDVDESLTEDLPLPDSSTLIQQALANRPDVHQLESVIEASAASLGAAQASRYPTVGVSGDVSKSRINFSQDSLNGIPAASSSSSPAGWSVGGQVNLPITDWLWAGGRIKERSAQLDIDRRNLVQKRTDVGLEVRQAWLQLLEARQAFTVAKEQLDYAEQSYELTREKYRLGSSTFLDLTTAEVQQTQSRSDLVDARVGLQLAKAALDKALGVNP